MTRGCWRLIEDDSGEEPRGTYSLFDGPVWQCQIGPQHLEAVRALLEWAQKREQRRAERSRGSR